MTDIESLVAIEQIKQLKARYFRCMDAKDWVGFQLQCSQCAGRRGFLLACRVEVRRVTCSG